MTLYKMTLDDDYKNDSIWNDFIQNDSRWNDFIIMTLDEMTL
jgi:hypothetical protein